jgi:hypothetical protein
MIAPSDSPAADAIRHADAAFRDHLLAARLLALQTLARLAADLSNPVNARLAAAQILRLPVDDAAPPGSSTPRPTRRDPPPVPHPAPGRPVPAPSPPPDRSPGPPPAATDSGAARPRPPSLPPRFTAPAPTAREPTAALLLARAGSDRGLFSSPPLPFPPRPGVSQPIWSATAPAIPSRSRQSTHDPAPTASERSLSAPAPMPPRDHPPRAAPSPSALRAEQIDAPRADPSPSALAEGVAEPRPRRGRGRYRAAGFPLRRSVASSLRGFPLRRSVARPALTPAPDTPDARGPP